MQGPFYGSPVAANGRLYAMTRRGELVDHIFERDALGVRDPRIGPARLEQSLSGHFLLMGTRTSRRSSRTACSEIASITPISRPVGSIWGTTPEVESVIRRLDRLSPSPSEAISSACLTLS